MESLIDRILRAKALRWVLFRSEGYVQAIDEADCQHDL